MVVCESNINNIMGGIENTGGVTLHNHRRKLKQRFDIIRKLGQGTYGKVQLGINKETGQEVAIKTIKKCKIETEADLVRIRREIQIMSSVQHPNIIHIYEVFENREKMVLVMEYAAGGELYDYLSARKVLTEDEARRIFRQIATAIYYCHKHKICHRDLKLENILLDEHGSAKIADFGLSNVFDEQRLLSTFCGSPLYASPEIVKGTPYHGPEVDCWSLGVLLYTLVYGAMPFDGGNFKRLVKQISQGDYFEPKKPSAASPLIRDMLTVMPEKRANIEKICAHWWVNANHEESCLDVAEELANLTPVRLDLLLSLAPPPPQVGSDQMVITGESTAAAPTATENVVPTRSQSVGSLMELVPSAERRIRDMVDMRQSPKRKLEMTVSMENANLGSGGAKRKEPMQLAETEDNICAPVEDRSDIPIPEDLASPAKKPMDVEIIEGTNGRDLSLEGAACVELIQESEMKEKKKLKKVAKPDQKESLIGNGEANVEERMNNKENIVNNVDADKKEPSKICVKKKIVKKKVTADKNKNGNAVPEELKPSEEINNAVPLETAPAEVKVEKESPQNVTSDVKTEEVQGPQKPVERRRSKIFETAERFQNLLTSNDSKSVIPEKPKKIFIPGVNVGGFKKEFERKASLTSAIPTVKSTLLKRNSTVGLPSGDTNSESKSEPPSPENSNSNDTSARTSPVKTLESKDIPSPPATTDDNESKNLRIKTAVSIISNAIGKDGTRKSLSKPSMIRKTPVPFGSSGRSSSDSIRLIQSPPPTPAPVDKVPDEQLADSKKSQVEITLKSATLPRRKTSKAEIQLDYPLPKPVTMEFKTEVTHHVEVPTTTPATIPATAPATVKLKSQKSEATFPVFPTAKMALRSASVDPEMRPDKTPKERIIPISFETGTSEEKSDVITSQAKPPMPKPFQSRTSQRYGSMSRQSTQDSDSEATASLASEPIRKSPREYIIPIAVEGGGYVTPRATSVEPSESNMSKFSKPRRLNSLLSDRDVSEDESVAHSEDSRREPFHMHRLRSSRPTRKANLEHTDSLSSGEEDEDDAFEILTAENLFSTLLSRVRGLTQRLNVEDSSRFGFPNSRLFSHFDQGSKLWNNSRGDSMSRYSPLTHTFGRERERPSAPWRRSVSRDLASDIDSVFNNTSPTTTATLPRDKTKKKDLSYADLNFAKQKLSDEDVLALSYLTPGLSRRIQKQLLSSHSMEERRRNDEPKARRSESVTRSGYEKWQPGVESALHQPTVLKRQTSNTDRYSKYNINDKPEHKPSRFLRPDFYSDSVYSKERNKRELETQKVLKEIRNRRISESRTKLHEPSTEFEASSPKQPTPAPKEVDSPAAPAQSVQEPRKKSGKSKSKEGKKDSKISKLVRPKSYPSETLDAAKVTPPEATEYQKKLAAQKSRVESTIRSLREQSEPRVTEHCATESGLIKRAVSAQDFSTLQSTGTCSKALQASKKSVSKILGLFKKYEDKERLRSNASEKTESKSNQTKTKRTSKLPITSAEKPDSKPSAKYTSIPVQDRRQLKLDLNKDYGRRSDLESPTSPVSLDTDSFRDENSALLSPYCDHSDSWSYGANEQLFTDDETTSESVSDRIHRKSFYSRFNEKKKSRKSSLVGSGYDHLDVPGTGSLSRRYNLSTLPRPLGLYTQTRYSGGTEMPGASTK